MRIDAIVKTTRIGPNDGLETTQLTTRERPWGKLEQSERTQGVHFLEVPDQLLYIFGRGFACTGFRHQAFLVIKVDKMPMSGGEPIAPPLVSQRIPGLAIENLAKGTYLR